MSASLPIAEDVAVGSSAAGHGRLLRPGRINSSTGHFVREYVEMVVAMSLGMGLLLPAEAVLRAFGVGSSHHLVGSPELAPFGMAIAMTTPMVMWMRHRGHRWRLCLELASSMAIATLAVMSLMWAAVIQSLGTAMLLEHFAVLPNMLAVMLLRRQEYEMDP
jgi:hypothetical protein